MATKRAVEFTAELKICKNLFPKNTFQSWRHINNKVLGIFLPITEGYTLPLIYTSNIHTVTKRANKNVLMENNVLLFLFRRKQFVEHYL